MTILVDLNFGDVRETIAVKEDFALVFAIA